MTASNNVLIPVGAIARGRIVRMEHRLRPSPHFLISLSWTQIEEGDGVKEFFARIDQKGEMEQTQNRARSLGTRTTLWLPPPGESKRAGGWLIFPTPKDRYVVPAGYETRWVTARALE